MKYFTHWQPNQLVRFSELICIGPALECWHLTTEPQKGLILCKEAFSEVCSFGYHKEGWDPGYDMIGLPPDVLQLRALIDLDPLCCSLAVPARLSLFSMLWPAIIESLRQTIPKCQCDLRAPCNSQTFCIPH